MKHYKTMICYECDGRKLQAVDLTVNPRKVIHKEVSPIPIDRQHNLLLT